jgi:hypothetical protein
VRIISRYPVFPTTLFSSPSSAASTVPPSPSLPPSSSLQRPPPSPTPRLSVHRAGGFKSWNCTPPIHFIFGLPACPACLPSSFSEAIHPSPENNIYHTFHLPRTQATNTSSSSRLHGCLCHLPRLLTIGHAYLSSVCRIVTPIKIYPCCRRVRPGRPKTEPTAGAPSLKKQADFVNTLDLSSLSTLAWLASGVINPF